MLEKIKVVPFIDESMAVRVKTRQDGKVVLERNNRVLWASEGTNLTAEALDCYVEAEKFFTLLPDIATMQQNSCLEIKLRNGAKYKLPFINVSWERPMSAPMYDATLEFKLNDLMVCTLKNLIKPDLQCIYIDSKGAVSCDFISACLNSSLTCNVPFLLPPDVQDLVHGSTCQVRITEDKIYFAGTNYYIVTSKPTMSADPWWEPIRGMLEVPVQTTKTAKLQEGLKRLAMFGDYVSFDGQNALVNDNLEPFPFVEIPELVYELSNLKKVLDSATDIGELDGNLVLKNTSSTFLVSAVGEDE